MLGTICHYDPVRKFGFIAVEGQKQTVFFHNAQQCSYYCDLDCRIYDNGAWDTEPKKGDEVIILGINKMPKGPQARAWAKAETLCQAEAVQSMMYTYRLQVREGYEPNNRFDSKPKIRIVWQGKNLFDLKHKTYGIKVDGEGQFCYFFEYLIVEEDRWEPCGDPRP